MMSLKNMISGSKFINKNLVGLNTKKISKEISKIFK